MPLAPRSPAGTVVALPCIDAPPSPLAVHGLPAGDPARGRAESFVAEVYRRAYGARIHTFYPHLLCIEDADGALVAVAGVRGAAHGPLYAEQYLDQPAERLPAAGAPVARDEVAEVGNLAPASAGQARWLIAVVTGYLHAAGFRRVVFTAVPALVNAFRRLDLPLVPVADADPARLHGGADDWGSYYRDRPRVCTGSIATGHALIARRVRHSPGRLAELWRAAAALGRRDAARLRGTATALESA